MKINLKKLVFIISWVNFNALKYLFWWEKVALQTFYRPQFTKYFTPFVFLDSLDPSLFKDLSTGQKWLFHYNSLKFTFISRKQLLKAFSFGSSSQFSYILNCFFIIQWSLRTSFDISLVGVPSFNNFIFCFSAVFYPSLYLCFNMDYGRKEKIVFIRFQRS